MRIVHLNLSRPAPHDYEYETYSKHILYLLLASRHWVLLLSFYIIYHKSNKRSKGGPRKQHGCTHVHPINFAKTKNKVAGIIIYIYALEIRSDPNTNSQIACAYLAGTHWRLRTQQRPATAAVAQCGRQEREQGEREKKRVQGERSAGAANCSIRGTISEISLFATF
jgi:hypothetical protein